MIHPAGTLPLRSVPAASIHSFTPQEQAPQ
jgi:hypothetical protein